MSDLMTLSRWLFDLYREAGTHSPGGFRDYVLERLGAVVRFDSAAWATGAMLPGGLDFHTITLWRQPPQLLRDYDEIKHLDPLLAQSARNPRRPIRATARTSLPPVFMSYVTRHGLEQAMSTIYVDPINELLSGVSLWRASKHAPFDDDDARMREAVFPRLMQAANRNLMSDIDRVDGRTDASLRRAIVDATAVCIAATRSSPRQSRRSFRSGAIQIFLTRCCRVCAEPRRTYWSCVAWRCTCDPAAICSWLASGRARPSTI